MFASINPVTVRVGGDVRLILAGGHKLTVHGRIEVNEGNSLTIYGQSSAGDILVVNNRSGNAGIGGCNGYSSAPLPSTAVRSLPLLKATAQASAAVLP